MMDRQLLEIRVGKSWTIFIFFVVSYFMLSKECSGEGDPKNYLINNFNKEQASKSYYPANFKRFRRGYGGAEESDSSNVGRFKVNNAQDPFGTYQKIGGGSNFKKGGTRQFGSRPAFGGPDAFLSAAQEEEPEDEPANNYAFPSTQGFSSIKRQGKGWGNSFNNGRSKGGGLGNVAAGKKPSPVSYNFGKGNSPFNQGENQNTFKKHGNSPFGQGKNQNTFKKHGNSPFSSMGSGRSGRYFGNFGTNTNSQPIIPSSSFLQKSPVSNNFPNPFSGGIDADRSSREKPIVFGSKSDFNLDNIEDLTGGDLFGSLGNLSAEDLSKLLRQIDPSTTTKKPNRQILEEDKDKIFSGSLNSENNDFVIANKLASMKNIVENGFSKKPDKLQEECHDVPTAINGRVICTSTAACRIDCFPNYKTSTGNNFVYLKCMNANWQEATGLDDIPICEPICDPECKNDGICLSPNVCRCSDEWEGPSCEKSKMSDINMCSSKPPTPINSRIFCSAEECIARCSRGYEFKDGVSRLSFICKMGNWEIKNDIGALEPDCKPICDNRCQNGGICIAPNICECSSEFRGPECQYPLSNCDPLKLNFNGGHNCTGEGMDFDCKFWCPPGVNFTFPASDFYKCDYATSQWSPSPVPECDYGFLTAQKLEHYGEVTTIESQTPTPGICFIWSNCHYKTFDGQVYSFESSCAYTLLQDSILGTFTVNLLSEDNCPDSQCKKILQIFTEGDQYTLTADADQPILTYKESSLAIPGQINDLVSERIAHFVILKLTGIGLTIKWDMQHLFIFEVSESLWNRTGGLCGNHDGSKRNDISKNGYSQENLIHFLTTWQANNISKTCPEYPITTPKCSKEKLNSGKTFCSTLLQDKKFHHCRQIIDANDYVSTCEWDYCSCLTENREDCGCQSISAFVKDCTARGESIKDNWRTDDFCPMTCKNGFEYKTCLPVVQPRCGQPADSVQPEFCVEGCDCPSGTFKFESSCIKPEECPCTYHNKSYSAWDVIPNECNTCTCISGKWACTEVKCGARCSAIGDPHYKTFDGKRFDFMGTCSYYLVKGEDFSIEAENVPCAGAISEAMNFPESAISDFPSCTKSVTIRVPGTTIEMKQKGEIVINGIQVLDLPVFEGDIYVKRASSLFTLASLPNKMEVWWDGQNRVYVDAPANMRSKTKGLCGTFNDNQKDDFLTSEADVEQNPISFANKWKTMEKCSDIKLTEQPHPCERHVQRKEIATKYCTRLRSKVFSKCHLEVDPEAHYRNCLYDMCSCETKLTDCMCPILASYGKECADKGIIMDWRSYYRECGLHCNSGQKYQNCGNSCTYTCYDISSNPKCKRNCVEGCACPEGFSLNSNEICVPISQCPCLHEDNEYKAGYEMMQNGEEPKVCKCKNGQWDCRKPTDIEMKSPEFFIFPQVQCLESNNEIYTDCMPGEEINCKNMHLRPELPPDTCRAGCICDFDFVRDVDSGLCVKSIKCPCHHGGKSYQESKQIVEDCNKCTCKGGVWRCTDEDCPARCTAWGDSHFKTFDGRIYDFHGICDYMLAKGKISKTDSFEATIQNIPCGTNGITCAKSISLRIGYGDKQEIITFSRGKPIPERNFTRAIIREVGSYVFAEVADMGLVMQWDKGTIAYITLNPIWKNKVKGLCGNYNEDENDDFQTPSGGVTEESAKYFGDSWRLQNRCSESVIVKDPCILHPHRKNWALRKCAILQSGVFSACHSEVPVEPYLERCQFDACGCDMGGDCHCLCTAISAYAQQCNIYGTPIRWRRPDFCPMQCDESCKTYQPCISACAVGNCEMTNAEEQSLCHLEICIEGCAKQVCLPGEVYISSTNMTCVPKSYCNKTCIAKENKVYYEGDIISQDDCHICFCMNHKEVCKGVPCSTTPLITTSFHISTSTSIPEYTPVIPESEDCRSGWSDWLNNDHPLVYSKNSDIELIPNQIFKTDAKKGFCQRNMVTDIQCRSLGHHQPPSVNVDCNIEDGLICVGPKTFKKGSMICKDFEISLFCDCSAALILRNTTITTDVIYPTPSQEPDTDHLPYTCDLVGWSPWMNTHLPTEIGEYETIDQIRKTVSTCPDHYLTNVECRPVKGPSNSWTTCNKDGAICNNNGRKTAVCSDYEIRIYCKCECQDGLGIQFTDFVPDDQLTASSSYSSKRSAEYGRLHGESSWLPTKQSFNQILNDYGAQWLQVDLLKQTKVTGILTQGWYDGHVTKFAIETSLDGIFFESIKNTGESSAMVFNGNEDTYNVKRNIFPSAVVTRHIRVIPLGFNLMPALRIEITGCDDDILQTTTVLSTLKPNITHRTCTNGWTQWINTNTPSPKDWNDIESYDKIREMFPLCEDRATTKVECRVAGVHTPVKEAGQVKVSCNKNQGLQCVDVLQILHCYDYEIRFFCDCDLIQTTETAISSTPSDVEMLCKPGDINVQHATNCQKFFKCDLNNKARYMVEETCGRGTLFNPVNEICDYPYEVYKVRPECIGTDTSTIKSTAVVCSDHYWTDWFNVSHPHENNGDYESYERITAAGFESCEKKYILDIECQFEDKVKKYQREGKGGKGSSRKGKHRKGRQTSSIVTQMKDYSRSGDYDVSCSIEEGLSCDNDIQPQWRGRTCQDYSIRFLCSCEARSALKPTTLPAYITTTADLYSDIRTLHPTTSPFMFNDFWCPPGKYYEEFAIRCTRVCIYYRQLLIQHGKCLDDDEEAPACVEGVSGKACPPGFFLRDNSTCVNIFDCNCMLHNGASAPPGKALLVSDCEICQCVDNDLVCDNSKCFGKPKEFSCDEWSPWMSISTPSGEGDFESLVKMKENNPHICWNPTRIQCRDKKTELTADELGQNVICDTSVGLLCYNWQNLEMCKDYEIRITCPCTEKEDEPTGAIKPKSDCDDYSRKLVDCGAQCDEFCHDQQGYLQQQGYCQEKYECVPACLHYGKSNFCPENHLISANWTCVTVDNCNCKLPDGRTVPARTEIRSSKCEICKCERNILQCNDVINCSDVETPHKTTKIYDSAVTTVVGISSTTTHSTTRVTTSAPRSLVKLKCNDWTPWMNMKRSNEGDFQKLQDIRVQYEDLCEMPTNISCRETNSKLLAEELQQILTCDPKIGFICRNSENNERCFDYEVSFFCECPEGEGEEHEVTTKGYGLTTEPAPCAAWSQWINDHHPWREDGDVEFKSLDQMRKEYGFCKEGHITDIECLESASGSLTTINKNVRCDKKYGLRCFNKDQDSKLCLDFKIRYFCSCGLSTSTRPSILVPTTFAPQSVCDPLKYTHLLNNVSDIAFAATSIRASQYSAADARFHNTREESGGAWIPAVSNRGQYLQIDLGETKVIYGLLTGGSMVANGRVTSYRVQFANDELSWSIVEPKILRGPVSNDDEYAAIFDRAIEARYIKIEPLTWKEFIAMRIEVLGCDFGTATPITTTEGPLICSDDMGLSNGLLQDSQIAVSSIFNDQKEYYGKENIRLNMPRKGHFGGAWVGEGRPGRQTEFVQIDFLQQTKISGVKIQGRDGRSEWVESFLIKYSPDGKIWSAILDDVTKKDKIFMANYDSNTVVNILFDRMIETRYIKLVPYSWRNEIAIRLEIIGCFQPYPENVTTEDGTTTAPKPPYDCDACPSLPTELYHRCETCFNGKKFDGRECITELWCPCYYDSRQYAIGMEFETADCQMCTCDLRGVTTCEPIECPPCEEENERPIKTAFCKCLCKPCPENTRLCPSNNLCLDDEKWCDGITHCPDDEINCPTKPPSVPAECPTADCPEEWKVIIKTPKSKLRCPQYDCKPPILTTPIPCQPPICPMEYVIVMEQLQEENVCPKYNCALPTTTAAPYACPPASCPMGYEPEISQSFEQMAQFGDYDYDYGACPQFKCVTKVPPTAPCPPPNCPSGYDIEYGSGENMMQLCPVYECIPKITTTKCPPVSCPDGLQTMYMETDELCPQYTCILVTTKSYLPEMPTIAPCPKAVLPICEPGDEIYQMNPTENCPIFKCKKIGSEPSTTEKPPESTTATCSIEGKSLKTFDDSKLSDILTCNHILARNKLSKKWIITVNQKCSGKMCTKFLRIKQNKSTLDLFADLSIVWNNHSYQYSHADMIGSTSSDFSLFHIGDSLVFSSNIYNFTVVWGANNIKIEVNKKFIYQIDGLCGQYTGHVDDDLSMPNGNIATSMKEYQESWLLPDGNKCIDRAVQCTKEQSANYFRLCNIVDSDPFTECHDVLTPIAFIKGCVERLCECLRQNKTEQECRCSILSTFITSCLEKKPHAKLSNWRIATKCYKECPAGEEYHDCYSNACEPTCSSKSLSKKCIDSPKKSCISGCFCEPGLVRKNSKCIVPELCRDCICESYADSHYVTYDRFNYSLISDCTYVATRDHSPTGKYSFQVKVKNDKCSGKKETCNKQITILFDDHELLLKATDSRLDAIFNGSVIQNFPAKAATANVEKLNKNHISVFIDQIQLELSFTLDNHGLTIRVPSSMYSGKLEGICGNCNGDDKDDLLTPAKVLSANVEEFGQSWTVNDEICQPPEEIKQCPTPLPNEDPCYKIMDDKLFGKCHPIEDPVPYLISCQLDYCREQVNEDSYCQTLEAYARHCVQLGVCLEWRSEEICPKNCSKGFKYLSCGTGCTKTCNNFKELEENPNKCTLSVTDGCFCEDGMVMDNNECIPREACIVCDSDGHRGGDRWKSDACTTCECSSDKGGTICNTIACPPTPICSIGFILVEQENVTDECCGKSKICELKPTEACPVIDKPIEECPFGKYNKLVHFPEIPCPEYICVCLEKEFCPQLITPSDDRLKNGEIWELDVTGCCDHFVKKCSGSCRNVDCPLLYNIKENPTSRKNCCPDFSCVLPENACIYETSGLELVQSQLEEDNSKLYKIGEKWSDGSCIDCECVKDHSNTPHAKCVAITCPSIENDAGRKEYVMEEKYLAGTCCPQIIRSACIEDGDVIKVNDTYFDPINGCRSVECHESKNGGIEKTEHMFSCSKDCPLGWQYKESPLHPQICCGACSQVACDDDGIIRNVGDSWISDDFCTDFTCDKQKGKIKIIAKQKQCNVPTPEEEAKYVYNKTKIGGECCTNYQIKDCLANGIVLPIGNEISDIADSCIIYSCEYKGSAIILREKEKACITDCPLGNVYVNPKNNSTECCGTCLQTQCIDNDELHPVGDTWENPKEKCFEYTCQIRDGTLTTVAIKTECPYFDSNCPKDKIIEDRCCMICNITRETKKECQPEEIPAEKTIGIFVLEAKQVGKCTNYEPVSGFKKCNGQCDSGTVFVAKGTSASHESECDCCKPSRFSQVNVPLKCEQGYTFVRIFVNIEECECQQCQSKKKEYQNDSPIVDENPFQLPFINDKLS